MPRIPIPTYQQRLSTPTQAPAANVPMVSVQDDTGRALAGVGQGIGQLADSVRAVDEEQARAWVSKTASDDQIKWQQHLQDAQDNSAPGAPDFTPKLLQSYDDYAQQSLNNAPNFAKRFYQTQLDQLRTYLGGRAITFQAQQQRANTVDQYQQGAQSDAAAIALDPSLYDARRAARVAALNTSLLPPGQKNDLIQKADDTMAYAAGAAMVDQNPHGALAAFNSAGQGQVQPGYSWITRLQPARIEVLRRRAQTQADTLDNKALLNSERLDARGQKALNDSDKQLSSGIPATSDQWLTWIGQAAGTPHEQEVVGRLQDEAQIQDVLRQPIAQQQAYVANRVATQDSQGANLAQQANTRRLAAAVQANVKTLQQDPLVYAQRRAGMTAAPLDLQSALTHDDASVIGPQIQDRVSTIRALQTQNPGQPVAMHPLLDDEAQALTNLFQAVPTQQKTQVLGTLYRAFGNDSDAYAGAMDQLAGVNPFMARMGQRAASYAQAKLNTNNWFSPDVVQSAGDVVGISLKGDGILHQGGKEGQGTLKFPAPKDEEFQAALQNKVGNLYRGAGDQYQQDAYAVKAYYVGRASQDGDISGQVDSGRMDQAIAAVLGTPINFHGNGQVLTPWGMNTDDFNTRATVQLARVFQQAGIQDKISQHMSNVGLVGAGGGVYFPTLAGQPIADKQGRPLTIRLTPDADAGRDLWGRSYSGMVPKDRAQITGAGATP